MIQTNDSKKEEVEDELDELNQCHACFNLCNPKYSFINDEGEEFCSEDCFWGWDDYWGGRED